MSVIYGHWAVAYLEIWLEPWFIFPKINRSKMLFVCKNKLGLGRAEGFGPSATPPPVPLPPHHTRAPVEIKSLIWDINAWPMVLARSLHHALQI